MPPVSIPFQPPRQDLLGALLSLAIDQKATDVHIRQRDDCLFRIGGVLVPLEGADGNYQTIDDDFSLLLKGLNLVKTESKSFMWPHDTHQVRVLYVTKGHDERANLNETIFLRIQPKEPPALEQFVSKPKALEYLLNAQGLVLIIGSMGAGKTTFAASLAQAWARQRRHIITLEDPIEYALKTSVSPGQVTQFPCSLLPLPTDKQQPMSFESAIYLALRCDADGLFIGECRDPATFRHALGFATAFEPCVTTLHAGSMSDAIIKAFSMAQHFHDSESAKLMLTQGLHSIVHVSLAFTEDGTPLPLVAMLPFKSEHEGRTILAKLDPASLNDDLADYMHKDIPEAISYDEARTVALAAGATEESIQRSIGKQLRGPSYLTR